MNRSRLFVIVLFREREGEKSLRNLHINLVCALIVISVKPDTLMDMVEHMTEKVALVHQMPFTCDREGFAATYEKVLKSNWKNLRG